MKKKIKNPFIAFLFLAFFMFGFQQNVQAQITVYNFTDCWVYFEANEGPGCSSCNGGSGGWIGPNGGVLTVANTCSSPQNWIYVKYGTSASNGGPLGQSGITYRPLTTCGVDQGTDCNGGITSHQWSVDSSTGEAKVAIQ